MQQRYIEHNPMIRKAFAEIMDRRIEQIPIIEHTFSPAFEERMQRLIRAQSKPYYRFVNTNTKKVVLALAAAFILLVTMVFSVSALREPVVRFIIEVYEKFSTVFFHDGGEEVTLPTTLEVVYEPSWLPEGYVFDDAMTMAFDISRISYFIKDSDTIVLQQDTAATGLNFNTEGIEIQSASVRGEDAILYRNKDTWTLIWNDGQYAFNLSGPVEKGDLLRIAESLQEK